MITMPKTKLGRWSVWFAVAVVLLIIVAPTLDSTLYTGAVAGDTILQDLQRRPLLAIPMLLAMLSGVSAFIVGLVAIIRDRERSWLTFLSTIFGGLLLLFIIGDLFSPE